MSISSKRVETLQELEHALQIREEVFTQEQGFSKDLELDEYENTAIHFLMFDENIPIGTCRLRWIDTHKAKVERVAIRKGWRGKGIGEKLMQALEEYAVQEGVHTLILGAQAHAIGFYRKLGYQEIGTPYFEQGVEHRMMNKTVS